MNDFERNRTGWDALERTLGESYFTLDRYESPEDGIASCNRSVSAYASLFVEQGFVIERLLEPAPPANAQTAYGEFAPLEWARDTLSSSSSRRGVSRTLVIPSFVVIDSRERMELEEIVLPETEPETEWVRGRALQKMSPMRDHALVQGEFVTRLKPWARGRGEVGPEWRFRIAVPGEARRPLVPDVSYVAAQRLRGLSHGEKQVPAFAPTLAIEILSLGDRWPDVESKIDVYLRGGSSLVFVVDPRKRTVLVCDADGRTELREADTLIHPALPEFTLPLQEFFATALDDTY